MKIGDLVSIHHEGYDSGGEVDTGIILSATEDIDAFHRSDNYSRWLNLDMLIDGQRKTVNVYWDDFVEVHNDPEEG